MIVYYSKNGTTKETVERIKNECKKKFDIFDLNSKSIMDLSKYDRIIIGCGIYMSHLPSKIVEFIKSNSSQLQAKKVIFFVHGLIAELKYDGIIESVVKKRMILNNYETFYLGGKLNTKGQNFIVKQMIRSIAKQNKLDTDNINTLNEQRISRFLCLLDN